MTIGSVEKRVAGNIGRDATNKTIETGEAKVGRIRARDEVGGTQRETLQIYGVYVKDTQV